eukprot:1803259-Rhodomonas_salina.1
MAWLDADGNAQVDFFVFLFCALRCGCDLGGVGGVQVDFFEFKRAALAPSQDGEGDFVWAGACAAQYQGAAVAEQHAARQAHRHRLP